MSTPPALACACFIYEYRRWHVNKCPSAVKNEEENEGWGESLETNFARGRVKVESNLKKINFVVRNVREKEPRYYLEHVNQLE